MQGWSAAALLGICLGFNSEAHSARLPKRPINPLNVSCLLRDGKFFTEILFSRNSSGEVTGEMNNYVSTSDHGRRFLNGSVFFDLSSTARSIEGSTGDKRGSISSFSLYPAFKSLSGQWTFEQHEPNGTSVKVRFKCDYRE
jgi:hypothetical protein